MMKITLIILSLLMFSENTNAKVLAYQVDSSDSSYLISGKLSNYDNGWIYIINADRFKKDAKKDSTKVINGEFRFSGKVSGIQPFILGVPNKDKNGKLLPSFSYQGPFFISPGHLFVEGKFYDWKSPIIAYGVQEQDEYNDFNKKIHPLQKKTNEIYDRINVTKKTDIKRIDSLNALSSIIVNEIHEIVKNHIIKFPNSFISPYIAKSNLKNVDQSILKFLYNSLSNRVKESVHGKDFQLMIQTSELADIGSTSPSFSILDSKGKINSLEENMGTFTLIDFWASWCGPCRQENPNLVSAHNSYRSKGFKIISISMDTQRHAWLKAINEDKLSWLQLSDLKGIQSETGIKYGITAIPMNFLIDKDGRIIARNLKGTELFNKLKELFP